MMNSNEYVDARVADMRSMAERTRRTAPVRSRRTPAQRLGEFVRSRTGKTHGIDTQH